MSHCIRIRVDAYGNCLDCDNDISAQLDATPCAIARADIDELLGALQHSLQTDLAAFPDNVLLSYGPFGTPGSTNYRPIIFYFHPP